MVIATAVSGIDPRDIMSAFAQYGFRKTSMEDIAHAVALSRQSIYKKFGSKDECYNWTLRSYMAGIYERAFELLDEGDGVAVDTLAQVFEIVAGEAVHLTKTRHGAELLEDALRVAEAQPQNWIDQYHAKMSDFLLRKGLVSTPERGLDVAHALITASRGALLVAVSPQGYSEDMRRILRTILDV